MKSRVGWRINNGDVACAVALKTGGELGQVDIKFRINLTFYMSLEEEYEAECGEDQS